MIKITAAKNQYLIVTIRYETMKELPHLRLMICAQMSA